MEFLLVWGKDWGNFCLGVCFERGMVDLQEMSLYNYCFGFFCFRRWQLSQLGTTSKFWFWMSAAEMRFFIEGGADCAETFYGGGLSVSA